MAADYGQLTENLRCFYDFSGKTVLFVGAGGRQLLDPGIEMKKVIAIDRNVEALASVKTDFRARSKRASVEIVASNFEEVTLSGDVVYFEFCLHEMAEPEQALIHAKSLAPDIVVFDHVPGSQWVYQAAEENQVDRSAEAMKRFGIRRCRTFVIDQRFVNYGELLAKIAPQGPKARQRAQRFAGASNIVIPMNCGLALL